METCVKIGFAQISLAAQNTGQPKIGGGGGGGAGVLRPPPPPGPYAYGCYQLFLRSNTCSFSKIWYQWDGLQFVQ